MTATDPVAAVRQYIDHFNNGDGEAMGAIFAVPGSILDGMAPPLHNNTTGDSAYVVIPATMTFKIHSQQVTQTGAILTIALRKLAEGWRIAAWAWAKGTNK